ncbi:MAG: hypothetical protein PVG92_08825, partial [Holophagae bacterium]
MRCTRLMAPALALAMAACGGATEQPASTASDSEPPAAAVETIGTVLSSEFEVDQSILGAWSGIRVAVSEVGGKTSEIIDAGLGEPVVLGESGLTMTAQVFLPDFVMDDGIIRNRTPEPHNPAARVAIAGDGAADYEGWIFASMAGLPPYPHP